MKKGKFALLLPVLALLAMLLGPPVLAAGAPRAVLNAKDGVVRIFCDVPDGTVSGSGFLISNDDSGALVVTNYHVVEGGENVVLFYDGNGPVDLRVVAISEARDLCVLRAPKALPGMAPLALASTVQSGEAVYALGYPGGSDAFSDEMALTKDEMALTSGLVSALPRSHQVGDQSSEVRLVQVNADINHGNSGGPLLNEGGKVIGVNAMGMNDYAITGINAAIHVDELRDFLQENDVQYAVNSGEDFIWSILVIAGLVIVLLVLSIWGVTRGEKKAASPAAPAPFVPAAPAAGVVPQSPQVQPPVFEPPAPQSPTALPQQPVAPVMLPGMPAPVQPPPPQAQPAAPAPAEESKPTEQLAGQLGLFEEAPAPKPVAAAAAVVGSPAISAPVPPTIGQTDAPDAPVLTADGFAGPAPGAGQGPGVFAPLPPPVGTTMAAAWPATGPVALAAAKKPLSRGKKGLLVAAASAVLLLLIVLFSGLLINQKLTTALKQKDYSEVLDIYKENRWIMFWADPRQQPYCEGMLLMKQGKYAAGLKKLQGLNGYADSGKAEIYVRAMNSDSARRQYVDFDSLGDYLDSAERTQRAAEKCYYAGEEFLIQGDFDSAEVYLENVLGNYENTAQYKKLIQQAKQINSAETCYDFAKSCYEMGFKLPPEIGKYYLEYFMVGDWVAQNGWEYFTLQDNQWDTNFKFNSNHDSLYMHDFGFYDEQEGGTPFVEIEIVNYNEIILRYWGYTKYMYRT